VEHKATSRPSIMSTSLLF